MTLELTEKQKELQKIRLDAETAYWKAQEAMCDSKNGCVEHVIQRGRTIFSPAKGKVVNTHDGLPDNWNDGSYGVYCAICDKDFGWHCPKNPKGYCEYDYKKHGDLCIFCGIPKERK